MQIKDLEQTIKDKDREYRSKFNQTTDQYHRTLKDQKTELEN
jgi:hypothetical protein